MGSTEGGYLLIGLFASAQFLVSKVIVRQECALVEDYLIAAMKIVWQREFQCLIECIISFVCLKLGDILSPQCLMSP